MNEFNGPFADNGSVPEGTKVAFIEDFGSLFQEPEGFTVGSRYWVEYAENAREKCCWPRSVVMTVVADEVTIVPDHQVQSVGGTNEFKHITSSVFVALHSKVRITFVKGGSDDSTVLFDAVEVFSEDFLQVRVDLMGGAAFPEITVHGMPGSTVEVRGSDSLGADENWQRVGEARLSAEALAVVADMKVQGRTRFYRAVQIAVE